MVGPQSLGPCKALTYSVQPNSEESRDTTEEANLFPSKVNRKHELLQRAEGGDDQHWMLVKYLY